MKLNYRDKMILIVVFVLLIIVAGFMLFIKPAIDECSQASSDLESAKVQLSELEDQVDFIQALHRSQLTSMIIR